MEDYLTALTEVQQLDDEIWLQLRHSDPFPDYFTEDNLKANWGISKLALQIIKHQWYDEELLTSEAFGYLPVVPRARLRAILTDLIKSGITKEELITAYQFHEDWVLPFDAYKVTY